MNCKCEGCDVEIHTCYWWQKQGFNAGLDWDKNNKHCFVFVVTDKGEFIIE